MDYIFCIMSNKYISFDLFRTIVEYNPRDSLQALKDVSPVIDRELWAMGLRVLFIDGMTYILQDDHKIIRTGYGRTIVLNTIGHTYDVVGSNTKICNNIIRWNDFMEGDMEYYVDTKNEIVTEENSYRSYFIRMDNVYNFIDIDSKENTVEIIEHSLCKHIPEYIDLESCLGLYFEKINGRNVEHIIDITIIFRDGNFCG